MTAQVSGRFEPDMDVVMERASRGLRLAHEVMQQTGLPFVTSLTIANDRISMESAEEFMAETGQPAWQAATIVGSYSRMDWVERAWKSGLISDSKMLEMLPHWWSGSDPDDTEMRFLALWAKMRRLHNNRVILSDPTRRLPRERLLTIYRGQDPVSEATPDGHLPVGIAWSLDKSIAERFARGAATRQSDREGIVYEGRVLKSKVIAYLTGRDEEEVIVHPFDIR